jgi:hypothetical protein
MVLDMKTKRETWKPKLKPGCETSTKKGCDMHIMGKKVVVVAMPCHSTMGCSYSKSALSILAHNYQSYNTLSC